MGDGDCVWHGGAAEDIAVMEANDDCLDVVPLYATAVMFWLCIDRLLCYICIFYYLYVDSLTYAFGWPAFLCKIRFCDILVIIFFK
jgi:hypothetical protein